ncbi:MAG: class I SAM-dependent methyltransferase [Candidatus Omnitrophota bacterium]
MEEIILKAKKVAADLEPWPDYFSSKAREFRTIAYFYGFGGLDSILEIGCGNGFTAALLSKRARSVTAIDLPAKDAKHHALGIGVARDLIRRMRVPNVSVVGATAEELPFSDNSFDCIFFAYALQYVGRKDRALQEMLRVLRAGGVVIAVVPNFTERVVAPFMKWGYIVKRFTARAIAKVCRGAGSVAVSASPAGGEKLVARSAWLEYFLLRPDGAYGSFLEEMVCHTLGSWKSLFEKNGYSVLRIFSTELLPLGLFDILGPSARRMISNATHRLNTALGGIAVIKRFGYSLCLVLTKEAR